MAHRELQVTVISAQDLKNVRLSGRAMSPYAEVWIRNSAATKVQTGVDTGGGINPSWNYVLRFPCEEELFRSGSALTIALRNRGSFFDKLIGTATVPLSDLSLQCKAADCNASQQPTLMSYQVRMRSGKSHGVLNISVVMGSLVKQPGYGNYAAGHPSESAPPVTAYPASTGYSQAASTPNASQYSQSNPQHYPPQQVYPPPVYPPQYQPQYAQPAAYNYQQAAY